jgi:chromate reductase
MTGSFDGERLHVVGLCGSLRARSFNRGLLRAAQETGREHGLEIELWDGLREIPPYDADYDTDSARPEPVRRMKEMLSSAAALVIATPEYNYSVPGVLKNAFDWASRPPKASPLNRKPIAIMGASTGMSGTIRAQLALRQSLLFTDSFALLQPEVLIPKCADRFDTDGNLVDQSTRDLVGRQMAAFAAWIRVVNAASDEAVGTK